MNFDTSKQPLLNFAGSNVYPFSFTRRNKHKRQNLKVGVGRGVAFTTGFSVPLSQHMQQASYLTFRSRIC